MTANRAAGIRNENMSRTWVHIGRRRRIGNNPAMDAGATVPPCGPSSGAAVLPGRRQAVSRHRSSQARTVIRPCRDEASIGTHPIIWMSSFIEWVTRANTLQRAIFSTVSWAFSNQKLFNCPDLGSSRLFELECFAWQAHFLIREARSMSAFSSNFRSDVLIRPIQEASS